MQRITSFSVDHDYIVPGMYISRIDGDITTYDLRTRKPNCGDYMDNISCARRTMSARSKKSKKH